MHRLSDLSMASTSTGTKHNSMDRLKCKTYTIQALVTFITQLWCATLIGNLACAQEYTNRASVPSYITWLYTYLNQTSRYLCWGEHQTKHQTSSLLVLCEGNPSVTGRLRRHYDIKMPSCQHFKYIMLTDWMFHECVACETGGQDSNAPHVLYTTIVWFYFGWQPAIVSWLITLILMDILGS